MSRKEKRKPFDAKFVIQGLAGAGKSNLMSFISRGELLPNYFHSYAADFRRLSFEGLELMGIDLGWRHKRRVFFRMSYRGTSGLIFIIDSANEENMDEAFDEINEFIFEEEEYLDETVLMILANKQDLEDAVGPHEMEARFRKRCNIKNGITAFVMPCSVTTNKGLDLAMTRFVRQMKFKKEGKLPTGLLPLAWETEDHVAWETANHIDPPPPPPKDETMKIGDSGGDSHGVMHKLKKAILKDPLKAVKAFLTC